MNYTKFNLLLFMIITCLDVIKVNGLSDPGFRQFCERFKGSYTPRTENIGDKCLLEVQVYTQDDKDALQLCRFRVPYEIISAKSLPGKATCHVETGYVCNPDWYLIHGKCYKKMDREEHYDLATAEQLCKSKGAQIAEIGANLVPLWGTFFRHLSLIWVRGAEGEKPKHDEIGLSESEKSMALAYGTAPAYGVSYPSLIRISKKSSALVLCEYTPEITVQQSVYLAKRWSKVYPNIGFKKSYMMIKNTKHVGYAREDVIEKYCKSLGKIIGIPKLLSFQAFHKSQMNEGNNELVDKLVYARGAVRKYSGKEASARRSETCETAGFFDDFKMEKCGSSDAPKSNCPLNKESFFNGDKRKCDIEQSTSVIMSSQAPYRLMPVSEAMRAPVLCVSPFPSISVAECEQGWHGFNRNGFMFCHKGFTAGKTWEEGQTACQEYGAHLTGYESHEEREFIYKISRADGLTGNFYIGAKRRDECDWGQKRYDKGWDDTPECNRNQVMEWKNGVASNSKKLFADAFLWDKNPDYIGRYEVCIEMLSGEQGWYPYENGDAKINDLHCEYKLSYVCGKYSVQIF